MDARNTTFGTLTWPRIELNRQRKFVILASNEAGISRASEAIAIPARPMSVASNIERSAVFQVQKVFFYFNYTGSLSISWFFGWNVWIMNSEMSLETSKNPLFELFSRPKSQNLLRIYQFIWKMAFWIVFILVLSQINTIKSFFCETRLVFSQHWGAIPIPPRPLSIVSNHACSAVLWAQVILVLWVDA